MNSAFYPFIRQLEWAAGIVRTDTGPQKLDKLEGVLEASAEDKTETAALVADLLSIPFGERYQPLQLTEAVQKQRTLDVLEEQLVLLSRRGTVLVLLEDMHWIDPTSIELIDRIIRRVEDLPVMIIVTYRPEFNPPWLDLGHVTLLNLNQLGRSQAVDLIRKTAGGKTLPKGDCRTNRHKVAGCAPVYRGDHAGNFGVQAILRKMASAMSCGVQFGTSQFRLPCRIP